MDTSSMDTSPVDHPPPFKDLSVKGFTPYYHVWRWCGLWSMPGDWNLYKVYSVFVQFSCFVVFNFIMFLSLPEAQSLDDVMEVLLPLTTTVLDSIKARLILNKRESLRKLFNTGKQLEAMIHDSPEEQEILVKATRQTRNLMIFQMVFCFVTITYRFVQSAMSDQRKLMWKSWMPFDWEHADSNWPRLSASVFQLLCNYYHGFMYTTFNPLAPYLYRMLSANLDILAQRLRNLGDEGDTSQVVVERKLIRCVEFHKLCLQYNHYLYEIFSVASFVQFIFNGFVICVSVYQFSVVSSADTIKITFLIFYLINMLIELFIPCYFGSLVSASSERLSDAMFQSKWNEQPMRFQWIVRMVIVGAQRPIVIYTLKGIFVVALPTFVTVCRAAYSLLSCLKGL